METNQANVEQKLALKMRRGFLVRQTLLRILGVAITLTAIGLMVTSKQTLEIFTIKFYAKYNYSPAFKYFVGANIVAVIMSMLSLLLHCVYRHPPYYAVFVSDFIATVLGVSGFAAASAIGYLGRYGNTHTYWNPICDTMDKFCKRVTISLILSGVGLIISVILTLWSAFRISTKGKVPVSM
ncbi:Uncharacterized protein family UPF0497 [Macleaya cordata]|uniref:CASP-like protein n=1 Tax=Macleaya cordata TaxID=56857 RepID=A0A200R3W7_MACCD|nr:Uncharacterized protein family UPF0497 [Macleaya cordata]